VSLCGQVECHCNACHYVEYGYARCCCGECRYALRRYALRRFTKCRGALVTHPTTETQTTIINSDKYGFRSNVVYPNAVAPITFFFSSKDYWRMIMAEEHFVITPANYNRQGFEAIKLSAGVGDAPSRRA
jgi:hypothetical protein